METWIEPGFRLLKDALRAERHVFDGSVVGEHSDDHITARGRTWRFGERRAFNDERIGLGRRGVIDRESVSGIEQIGRHAATHVTKPDEPNPHDFKLLNAKA